MIKILISPSCQGCRKTIKFFTDNKIPFKELNIMAGQLNKAMIKDILSLTENGSEDIISSRSKVIKAKNIEVNNLYFDQVYDLILRYPMILKRPIIYQSDNAGQPRRLKVGYNSSDIEIFLRDAGAEKSYYQSHAQSYGRNAHATNAITEVCEDAVPGEAIISEA